MHGKVDLLVNARRKIIDSHVAAIEQPPSDFKQSYSVKLGLLFGGTFGSLGAVAGAHMGIAAFGTAVSGIWVLAPILGVAGFAAAAAFSGDEK